MITPSRHALAAALLVLAAAGCGNKDKEAAHDEANTEKMAHEAAIAVLKQPIALIAGYSPYARFPEPTGKFFPARHIDLDKSTLCAANEIRYAANQARQKLEVSRANATKDIQAALRGVTGACAEADEAEKLGKCADAVKALDIALERASSAAAAMGVGAKYPRVAPEAVTVEARAAMASFLKARGPSANESAFVQKRNDPSASPADVLAACQSAQEAADAAAQAYEKADEPIRLVAVTRKMALDTQCRRLGERRWIEQGPARLPQESQDTGLQDCLRKGRRLDG